MRVVSSPSRSIRLDFAGGKLSSGRFCAAGGGARHPELELAGADEVATEAEVLEALGPGEVDEADFESRPVADAADAADAGLS